MIGGFFFSSPPPAPPSSFHAVSCEISKSGHVESGFSRLLLGNVACFALCNMQKQPVATSDELLLYKGLGNWVIPFYFFSVKCGNSYFIIQILFGRIFFLRL